MRLARRVHMSASVCGGPQSVEGACGRRWPDGRLLARVPLWTSSPAALVAPAAVLHADTPDAHRDVYHASWPDEVAGVYDDRGLGGAVKRGRLPPTVPGRAPCSRRGRDCSAACMPRRYAVSTSTRFFRPRRRAVAWWYPAVRVVGVRRRQVFGGRGPAPLWCLRRRVVGSSYRPPRLVGPAPRRGWELARSRL